MFQTRRFQLVHYISEFGNNSPRCRLSFPEVLVVNFSRHGLDLRTKIFCDATPNSRTLPPVQTITFCISKTDFVFTDYLLLDGFYFGSELLAPPPGPPGSELGAKRRLRREGMFGSSVRLENESLKIFFQNRALLKDISCSYETTEDTDYLLKRTKQE